MAAQKVWLPNFPAACLGEKLGLKLPKYFYKMLSLLVVDSSACAGGRCVWALCFGVVWQEQDRISCSSTGPTIPSPG